jgi:hypothetical protein
MSSRFISLIKSHKESGEAREELISSLKQIIFGTVEWNKKATFIFNLLSECTLISADGDIVRLIILSSKFGKEVKLTLLQLVAKLANSFMASPKVLTYVIEKLELRLHDIVEAFVEMEVAYAGQGERKIVTGFDSMIDNLVTAITHASKNKEDRDTALKDINWVAIKSASVSLSSDCDIVERCDSQINRAKPPLKKPLYVSLKQGESVALLKQMRGGRDMEKREEINIDLSAFKIVDEREEEIDPETGERKIKRHEVRKDEISEAIKSTLSEADRAMISGKIPSMKTIELDILRDRLWGPANGYPEKNCLTAGQKLGPCRMLSCNCCIDLDEEEDYDPYSAPDPTNWFVKQCENCEREIANVSYAVRFPVTGGGWIGCYCSFKCMLKNPPRPIYHETEMTLERVQEIILHRGIMDRA